MSEDEALVIMGKAAVECVVAGEFEAVLILPTVLMEMEIPMTEHQGNYNEIEAIHLLRYLVSRAG